ncbi:MAG TPA: hypothetical protein VGR15_10775 [Bacteroidota bacterium]|nr:hypothetical protein [Bacteroidota bacterium]
MPNFARKYGMSCTGCHNGIPRLNETGFKFRAAGFRMPDEIGKGETSTNVGDYVAARTQIRADWKQTENAGGAVTTNSKQLTFHEVTFYPITGAFAKNFASLVEMSFLSDEAAEIENAYVRYDAGEERAFFSARAGVMHPFEGYGASDRPLSLSRPLFQTAAVVPSTFTPWGKDEVGVEVGYDVDNTSIRGTVFNGLTSAGKPAQGGGLTKTPGLPSYNNKDFQVFATQRLTDDGGGLSGYFYAGWMDPNSALQNAFQRYALYAGYPVGSALFLGGFQAGKDQFTSATAPNPADISSNGFFGEADYNASELLWFGVRYDRFDPSGDASDDDIQAVTGFANYSFDTGLQFIGEYQYKDSKKGSTGSQKDHALQVRMIFIY